MFGIIRPEETGLTDRQEKTKKGVFYRMIVIMAAVLLNVILSFINDRIGMPIYLDTIGTIAVAVIGGFFPGVITGVLTNLFCSVFASSSVYYAFLNALIAILTVYFIKKNSIRDFSKIIRFIALLSLVSGVISFIIQLVLHGGPEDPSIADTVNLIAGGLHIPAIPVFLIIIILLNVIDKGLSFVIAMLIIRFVPERISRAVGESGWRQRPLSGDEIESIEEWGALGGRSIRHRTTLLIAFILISLSLTVGIIGLVLNLSEKESERREQTESAAGFAAGIIDAAKIEDFLIMGEKSEDYTRTAILLERIKDSSPGMEELAVIKVKNDGIYYIFDMVSNEENAHNSGVKEDISPQLGPYIEPLLRGEDIGQVENKDFWGWETDVFKAVRNSNGSTVCYVLARTRVEYFSDSVVRVLTRLLMALLGFFVLALATGMWYTAYEIVYPLNSVASQIDNFVEAGGDIAVMEDHVRQLRQLDIHTGDEVERMYHSVCKMATDTAEKLREIRYYAESTAQMQSGLIITMADMVESRDSDTGAHIQKTAAYVKIIVEGLQRKGYYPEKINEKFISDVVMSAPLHDVGKINIPDKVLNKPGKLTDEEYEIMKTHTTAGRHIMESAISTVHGESYLKEARNMAAYHHERWDGKGYPEGLHGEVIPLSARIMAVADVFDALTSPRVYKPAFPLEKALGIINEGSGSQFDEKCVEVFMESLDEVKKVLKKYNQL